MENNLENYHKSVTLEFTAAKDRIRNLIGSRHWLSDGKHKEAILQSCLRTRMPGKYLTSGFILTSTGRVTTEIDIMVVDAQLPRLFDEYGTTIITADAVSAIIEVKTKQNCSDLYSAVDAKKTLSKLSDNIEMIRQDGNIHCKAGLFIYEECCPTYETVLEHLQASANESIQRAVNWISIGPDYFYHFWNKGDVVYNKTAPDESEEIAEDCWHAYKIEDLAQPYFISNVCMGTGFQHSYRNQSLWYPIKEGKEASRLSTITLSS